jgi:hypothetical protein
MNRIPPLALPLSSLANSHRAASAMGNLFRSPYPLLPSACRSTRSQRPREGITAAAHYHVPATVSATELLDRGSDRQFRGLVQDLLTVARRLENGKGLRSIFRQA